MTARGFDHVVWTVRDLAAAARFMEQAGFRVTPRARHPWGTENHLVQLDGFFIEILGIGDETLIPEAVGDSFSFGAFNRDFVKSREGVSMLVMESRDPAADRADFEQAGLHQSMQLSAHAATQWSCSRNACSPMRASASPASRSRMAKPRSA